MAFHNFSNKEVTIELDLEDKEEVEDIVDIFGNERYETFNPKDKKIRITAYGYRWLHKRNMYL